jgi:hypothetical protein
VVVRPTSISHIANLHLDILVDSRPAAVFPWARARILLFLFLIVQQVIHFRWGSKSVETIGNSFDSLLVLFLALLDDGLSVNCYVDFVKVFGTVAFVVF